MIKLGSKNTLCIKKKTLNVILLLVKNIIRKALKEKYSLKFMITFMLTLKQ
jgi:hypothetical protein